MVVQASRLVSVSTWLICLAFKGGCRLDAPISRPRDWLRDGTANSADCQRGAARPTPILIGPEAPNLPPDLAQQPQTSKLLGQYCPAKPRALCRPDDLHTSDLTFAFEKG
jgi:hypothetical protein